MASARIGPGRTPTGLRRLALTDADREMRDLFARWCRDAGCTVTVDRMGNMFARRPGTDETLPPVLARYRREEAGWVRRADAVVTVNDAKVIKTDIICSNGVIHWIDTVVMP